jgi:hypothetical protein
VVFGPESDHFRVTVLWNVDVWECPSREVTFADMYQRWRCHGARE